ncbi:cytokine-inducible SH2-containing protein [Eupeodes corollae]|uniref:cytokine-inducible SH2-containing protein n=1 Tax=Eupeodes corollae TaxID=290404 RepID=UPI002492CFE0|nr:cytokine-inducible SH2-containing protein [Eupeodes corollae]
MTNESTENPNHKNEKRNWFHSLSRRRKSSTSTTTSNSTLQKQQSRDEDAATANAAGGGASASTPASAATSTLTSSQESSVEDSINNSTNSGKDRSKRKDERKNVFQRFKKRIGINFSMRQKKSQPDTSISSNSNFNDVVEGIVCYPNDLLPLSAYNPDPPEMIPFTHHYRKFVKKKWRQNLVMYTACSEMLGQVWYWGEISRRDAQRQLKDKPIGSFLVRDSETEGPSTYWYTLSFRILNCTLHYRLEYRSNYWHFEELKYPSIVEMIEDILHRCTKDHFVCYVRVSNELQPPHAVVLKHPLSRYISIMKLQDLCRSVIQRHVPIDDIQELQIPVKLQEYLREKRELVFQSS